MRSTVLRNTLIHASILAAVLSGGLAFAEEDSSHALDPEIQRARETLIDLLASEQIDRIDFQAETFEEAMYHLRTTADTILLMKPANLDVMLYADRAGQVIEAFNSHRPRGMTLTFGKNVKNIPVQNPGDARMLGEVVGKTVSIIGGHFGEESVSYRDMASKLFRSVILEVGEGALLVQYEDGIQRVSGLPYGQMDRYFR